MNLLSTDESNGEDDLVVQRRKTSICKKRKIIPEESDDKTDSTDLTRILRRKSIQRTPYTISDKNKEKMKKRANYVRCGNEESTTDSDDDSDNDSESVSDRDSDSDRDNDSESDCDSESDQDSESGDSDIESDSDSDIDSKKTEYKKSRRRRCLFIDDVASETSSIKGCSDETAGDVTESAIVSNDTENQSGCRSDDSNSNNSQDEGSSSDDVKKWIDRYRASRSRF